MDAARRREALESQRLNEIWQKQYENILEGMVTTQPLQANVGQIFGIGSGKTTSPMASILSKDMTDFFSKRDDLLRDIFLDKLAGDMSKWKFASTNSTHQVVIKGPKGWSIVGNQNEGQLLHDSKVIYRATSAEYQALKPMAVSVVQIIQKAMDAEIERLKTSLVEDLNVPEEYDAKTLPSLLVDSSMDSIKYSTLSAASSAGGYGILRNV